MDACKNEGKFLIPDTFLGQNKWYQTPGSTQSKEGAESKFEARKTTCHAPKGYDRKASYRSGLRRKHEPDHIDQPSDVTRRISVRSKIATGKNKYPTAYKHHT